MITILLAPTRVTPGHLDVAAGRGTNPDITPGWRNSQAFNSKKALLIANWLSFCIEVLELVATPSSRVARRIVMDVMQTSFFGCGNIISDSGFWCHLCASLLA